MQIDENERISDMLRSLSLVGSSADFWMEDAETGHNSTLGLLNKLPSMRPTEGFDGSEVNQKSSTGDLSFLDHASIGLSEESLKGASSLMSIDPESKLKRKEAEDWYSKKVRDKKELQQSNLTWMSVDPERERKRKEAEAWYQKKVQDKKTKNRPSSWMSIDPERKKKRKAAEDWYQQQVEKGAKDNKAANGRLDKLSSIAERIDVLTQQQGVAKLSSIHCAVAGSRGTGDSFDLNDILDEVGSPAASEIAAEPTVSVASMIDNLRASSSNLRLSEQRFRCEDSFDLDSVLDTIPC
jgi:hypothetical protein